MKLVYYNQEPNFGDALSPMMWNALLPNNFLDEDESELFLGIGSILWDNLPVTPKKHVFGSGFGGYTRSPDVHDGSWNILFVRGPRTARLLQLPSECAVSDAAVLLRLTKLPDPKAGLDVAFMPHFESLERGYWQEACRLAGITLIDPRGDPFDILSMIQGAKMLITEAMHGAIVADTLRTPWISVEPLHSTNRMKWFDWAESLDVNLRWHQLRPSSLMERYHARNPKAEPWRASKTRENKVYAPVNRLLTHMAAQRLHQISRSEPQLSDERSLDAAVEKAAALTGGFLRHRGAGDIRFGTRLIAEPPSV